MHKVTFRTPRVTVLRKQGCLILIHELAQPGLIDTPWRFIILPQQERPDYLRLFMGNSILTVLATANPELVAGRTMLLIMDWKHRLTLHIRNMTIVTSDLLCYLLSSGSLDRNLPQMSRVGELDPVGIGVILTVKTKLWVDPLLPGEAIYIPSRCLWQEGVATGTQALIHVRCGTIATVFEMTNTTTAHGTPLPTLSLGQEGRVIGVAMSQEGDGGLMAIQTGGILNV